MMQNYELVCNEDVVSQCQYNEVNNLMTKKV